MGENENENKLKQNDDTNYIISDKKYVYVIIFSVILSGILVPYAAQFILPFFFKDSDIAGAEVWNQYVSIVLGIIATIVSIISLKISFDSVESAKNTEKRTRDILHHIENKLSGIEQSQHYMENYLINKPTIDDFKSPNNIWERKPEGKEI